MTVVAWALACYPAASQSTDDQRPQPEQQPPQEPAPQQQPQESAPQQQPQESAPQQQPQDPAPQQPAESPPANQPDTPRTEPAPPPPSATVLEPQEAQGILGREVRTPGDESMGRIVDVVVDGAGQVRAAIIDFGGFLGVGSRKIAVDWKALHFAPAAPKRYRVFLELTRDQLKAAPEYREKRPLVILGPTGNLEPLRFNGYPGPEK